MALAVTYPETLEMIVGEQLNLTIDLTNVLGGDVVDRPVVVISNVDGEELVPSALIGAPTMTGNVVSFTLSSAPLRPGSTYFVTVICTNTITLGVSIGSGIVVGAAPLESVEGVKMTSIVLTVKVIY